uniref:Uncharacterized protein n=1 Tax=uncultured marine virus TaxID=186617 RepID=A0A0F7L5J3_9VIRU|nr:hypothetical protein [uncultured marine virus]
MSNNYYFKAKSFSVAFLLPVSFVKELLISFSHKHSKSSGALYSLINTMCPILAISLHHSQNLSWSKLSLYFVAPLYGGSQYIRLALGISNLS